MQRAALEEYLKKHERKYERRKYHVGAPGRGRV
jgi:hypothetical protein